MYCSRCGGALDARAQFCPGCGAPVPSGVPVTPVAAGPGMTAAPSGRVRRHIGTLAVLWMLNGILRLLEVFFFTLLGHTFWWGHRWGGWPFGWSIWPFSMGMAWLGSLLAVFGLIHLILAWGLYERKQWARPLGLVIGVLALIRFPLGTALGIYTLWVLLPEMSRREYDQIAVP